MNILEIRRENLRALMRKEGASTLAKRLGYRQSSFLSQMAGPNPTREITENTVRAFEVSLGLSAGALDKPLGDLSASTSPQLTTDELIELVTMVTRKVGLACESANISLPPGKFGNVLAMVIKDTADHGYVVRESHINDVVELLK